MGCIGAGKGGGVLVWGAEVVSINLSIFFFVEQNKMFFSTVADKHPPYEQGHADLGRFGSQGGHEPFLRAQHLEGSSVLAPGFKPQVFSPQ